MRGAAHVMFVRNHAQAMCTLHAVRGKLGAHMVDIVPGDAFAWFARQPDAAFDAALTDPPSTQGWTLCASEATAWAVKLGGTIYAGTV